MLTIELIIHEDIDEVVLWLFFTGTATSTPSVNRLRVGAFGRMPFVLLLDVRVEGWIAEIALATATDECAAHVIILTTTLIAHLIVVCRVPINVIWVHIRIVVVILVTRMRQVVHTTTIIRIIKKNLLVVVHQNYLFKSFIEIH